MYLLIVQLICTSNSDGTNISSATCRYRKYCTVARLPGSGRQTKLTNFVFQLVNQQMHLNDETTAMQLHDILIRHGVSISLRTVLRSRQQLGWTFRGSAYCQLIRDANKIKRLDWARQNITDTFANVIWTDEASVQLETHRKRCYRKKGDRPKPKPRPKHPIKVHVWAGISMQGATEICIFTGMMNAEFYVQILRQFLLPFIQNKFPDEEHRFMQDNDPKHVSCKARAFFEENEINWWRTPPESPDLNPIENVWHELKEHLRSKVKPRTQAQLIAGIKSFWSTVDTTKCRKYIHHLQKVIPRVIEVQGDATGY